MLMIEKSGVCAKCGAPLPKGADARGICSRCMLEWAFGADETVRGSHPDAEAADAEPELSGAFGPYLIECRIGRGGMGVVYLATHESLQRRVAIKVLPEELARDPQFTERFQREARAMAALSHPNIVAVHDFGCIDGRYFFAMEYVEGASLRALIAGGKLTPARALAIVPQICDALQYAHGLGVVHRDIKPENILLAADGTVKIADFGLAKMVGGNASHHRRLTRSDLIVGTLHYMAPEQLERPRDVDHRADIYSLGVVFYEVLTGELPLGRFDPPSRKAKVSARLDDVVLRSLEKQPERRYQHASEVKIAALKSRPLGPERLMDRFGRRTAAFLMGAGAACVALVLLTFPRMAAREPSTSPVTQYGLVHIVQPGDTLTGIAARYYSDYPEFRTRGAVRELISKNRGVIHADGTLQVGMKLSIPPPMGEPTLREKRREARNRLIGHGEDLAGFPLGSVLYDQAVAEYDQAEVALAEAEVRVPKTWKEVSAELAASPHDAEATKWIARLSPKSTTAEREEAVRALVDLYPHARTRLHLNDDDPDRAGGHVEVLAVYGQIDRLAACGEKSLAFWTEVWRMRHDDPDGFRRVFRAALGGDAAALARVEMAHDSAHATLAQFMTGWSEVTRSDLERDLMRGLEQRVRDAGVAIAPGLVLVLQEDRLGAFARISDEPFESVWTRKTTARDQVKAIFGLAWLKLPETVPVLATHLKSPSLTAQSQATHALEAITGLKFTEPGEYHIGEDSRARVLKWWEENRSRYASGGATEGK